MVAVITEQETVVVNDNRPAMWDFALLAHDGFVSAFVNTFFADAGNIKFTADSTAS